VLFCWMLLAGAVRAQPETSRVRFVHWMYEDLGALAKATATPKTGLFILGTAGATAGLAALDDDAQDGIHEVYHGTFKEVLEVADYLGGPKINIPVFVAAGGSLLTNDTKLQDAAFTSFQTLVYAGLLGYALKGIFGRSRPEVTDDPYAFFATTGKNPFTAEGNSSYPSGHAIAAFGIVTPWVLYYPGPVTYALYVLPAGTVLSRMARDKHWATDIAVGATIGVLMGRFLTNRHKGLQQAGEPVALAFLEDGQLVRLRVRL
jgi:membrane-associated phospholipid phosphatase